MKKTHFFLFLLTLPFGLLLFVFNKMTPEFVANLYEPYENDSIPFLNDNSFTLRKVKEYPPTTSSGSPCTGASIQTYGDTHESVRNSFDTFVCKQITWNNGYTIYYIEQGSFQQQILWSTEGTFPKSIIFQKGEYPGNHLYNPKFTENAVFFSYKGWNNPEKIIELRLK